MYVQHQANTATAQLSTSGQEPNIQAIDIDVAYAWCEDLLRRLQESQPTWKLYLHFSAQQRPISMTRMNLFEE